jgi:hypothetical protein
MTTPAGRKIFALGLVLTSLSASLMWLPPLRAAKALTPERETRKGVAAPAPPSTETPEQPIDVVLAAPYWSTADGFVSTIEMKNFHVVNPLTPISDFSAHLVKEIP